MIRKKDMGEIVRCEVWIHELKHKNDAENHRLHDNAYLPSFNTILLSAALIENRMPSYRMSWRLIREIFDPKSSSSDMI
jgi:hypothetical protein